MMPMEDAFRLIVEKCSETKGEIEVGLEEALGYVLAEDVQAEDDLPPFRASVMDGYAIKANDKEDTRQIIEATSFAGQKSSTLEKQYNPEDCLYVTTGAPVPSFFDTVIPIEHTSNAEIQKISIIKAYKPG